MPGTRRALTSTAAYKMFTIYRQQTGMLDVPAEGRDERHGRVGKLIAVKRVREDPMEEQKEGHRGGQVLWADSWGCSCLLWVCQRKW